MVGWRGPYHRWWAKGEVLHEKVYRMARCIPPLGWNGIRIGQMMWKTCWRAASKKANPRANGALSGMSFTGTRNRSYGLISMSNLPVGVGGRKSAIREESKSPSSIHAHAKRQKFIFLSEREAKTAFSAKIATQNSFLFALTTLVQGRDQVTGLGL